MPPRTHRKIGPILVVDDDPDCRDAVRAILEDAGFKVVEAAHGKAALEYLLSSAPEPSLVLLDLRMPVMSGWELVKVLKTYLRLSRIPVVLISGADVGPRIEFGGALPRLPKPYTIDALRDAVERFAAPTVTGNDSRRLD